MSEQLTGYEIMAAAHKVRLIAYAKTVTICVSRLWPEITRVEAPNEIFFVMTPSDWAQVKARLAVSSAEDMALPESLLGARVWFLDRPGAEAVLARLMGVYLGGAARGPVPGAN